MAIALPSRPWAAPAQAGLFARIAAIFRFMAEILRDSRSLAMRLEREQRARGVAPPSHEG